MCFDCCVHSLFQEPYAERVASERKNDKRRSHLAAAPPLCNLHQRLTDCIYPFRCVAFIGGVPRGSKARRSLRRVGASENYVTV